ncbi:hypothetical protein, partial [Hymenobacter coccineus]|uniref:hypothetical protein n=1 Tax=Hymenobacter coccineus TaxID=1908235 RepID=UPI0013901849
MERTPYSAGPRGETNYPVRGPGPAAELSEEKYIFVYQDVRPGPPLPPAHGAHALLGRPAGRDELPRARPRPS